MIVYKWVIKKDNFYYPLVLFGVHPTIWRIGKGLEKVYPYKKGMKYSKYYDLLSEVRNLPRSLTDVAGFHFWKDNNAIGEILEKYNKCMSHYYGKKIKINAILKCFVDEADIISEGIFMGHTHIVSKKFKVLDEVKI